MVGSITGLTPKPVTLPVHARCRFSIALDTISGPAPKLFDSHQAIIKNILTDLDYASPLAGFTPGPATSTSEVKGHGFIYSLQLSFFRTPQFGTPAQKTDLFYSRLMAILCEHTKGLTVDGSISPTYRGEVLSDEKANVPNTNFDGVLITLHFNQCSIRPVTP